MDTGIVLGIKYFAGRAIYNLKKYVEMEGEIAKMKDFVLVAGGVLELPGSELRLGSVV